MNHLTTSVPRRFIALVGVFSIMSFVGHWYECLLELLQTPFGYELGADGVWRQLLEPYPAYGWLAVFMVVFAFVIAPLFRSPHRALTKTMYFALAGAFAILFGSFDHYVPTAWRLLPLPSVFSTLLFSLIVFGLAVKFESKVDDFPFRALVIVSLGSAVVVLLLQFIFGA